MSAWESNDGSLAEKDLKKIHEYYGLAVPAILGEAFALLRGKPLQEKEREIQTYLGALTGLFDDLYDDKELSDEEILIMVQNPENSKPQSSFEELFLKFYMRALKMGPRRRIIDYLVKGHHAQVASREQANSTPSQERIAQITREKGGVFLQFYRCGFEAEPRVGELKMLYRVGALGQLENDIFDVYKDHKEGIQTLATTCVSIEALRAVFVDWTKEYNESLNSLHAPEDQKRLFERFTRILYLRGLVCLDQLSKCEQRAGESFNPSNHTREELICDMAKVRNQLRLWGYFKKGDPS